MGTSTESCGWKWGLARPRAGRKALERLRWQGRKVNNAKEEIVKKTAPKCVRIDSVFLFYPCL